MVGDGGVGVGGGGVGTVMEQLMMTKIECMGVCVVSLQRRSELRGSLLYL